MEQKRKNQITLQQDILDLLGQVCRATGRQESDLLTEAVRAMWWASVGQYSHPTQKRRLATEK